MKYHLEQKMLHAGAIQRLQELGVTEKSAMQLVPLAKNVLSAGVRQAPKMMKAVTGTARTVGAELPELVGNAARTGVRQIANVTPNPGIFQRAGQFIAQHPKSFTAAGTAAATGTGAYAWGQHEKQNILDNYQRAFNEYQQNAGLNSGWGRFKAGLGYLFGGQNYTDKLMGDGLAFMSTRPYFSRSNRTAFADAATRRGFRPANTTIIPN